MKVIYACMKEMQRIGYIIGYKCNIISRAIIHFTAFEPRYIIPLSSFHPSVNDASISRDLHATFRRWRTGE